MKKTDLLTGDIIVNRGGELGVVLKENETVLYQLIGSDSLDEFNEDLTFDDEFYPEGDVMQVYRDVSFFDVDNDDAMPIYQRDFSWRRPTEEERRIREEKIEKERREEQEKRLKEMEEKKKDIIYIVSQFYYGNRTGTEVRRDDVDYFLRGICLSPYRDKLTKEDAAVIEVHSKDTPVDRQYIHVPGDENIVIVYDRVQENKAVADGKTKYVSCTIPELNITLYSRCFACRIDENGTLQSLQDGDGEKYIEYFPVR